MKTIIKLVSVLLVICVLAGMGACGKKTELPEKQLLENVYKTENFPMPENMQYINYLNKTENGYIVYGEVLDEENGYRYTFAKLDNEFKLVEYFDVDLGLEENVEGWFGEIVVADDGSIYTTISTNFYDEKTGYYESKNYLVHLDESFKVINRVLSTELLGLESGTYCYINNLTPLSGGRLAFFSDGMLYITDESNQIVFKATQEQLDASYFSYLMNTPHGVVLLYDDQEYNTKAVILDTEALTFSESYDFSNLGYGQYYPGSGKYDIYYAGDSGIYGYSFETGENIELLNYMNSDMNNIYPNQMIPLEDESFVCTTWNYDDSQSNGMVITRLSPMPDTELKPKYIITLGGLYINYNLRNHIFKFNRSNDEYRIVLKDYSENIDYSEESEYTYEDAVAKLNGDIAAGNVPDLFVCDSQLPFDSYSSKGLFEDLYKYIDSSETLSREMLEQNVLSAYENDGKLYRITPMYSVRGFTGLRDIVGKYENNWNMGSLLELANTLPEGSDVFQDMMRGTFIQLCLTAMYDEFIDVDTGRCNFDDGTFEKVLEYAATLSETSIFDNMDWSDTDDSFWKDYDSALYEGRVALIETYMSSFENYTSLMSSNFRSDDLVLLGYPGVTGAPVIVDDSAAVAISSKSKLKDGAWAFVSSLLSPEFQDKIEYNFPILTSSLEKVMENQIAQAQERKKRAEDIENGNIDVDFGIMQPKLYATSAALVGQTYEMKEYYLDEVYANQVLDFIRSADKLARYDKEILKIVNEEAGRFFEGQCSAQQAAAAVQGRVSIYVSENS